MLLCAFFEIDACSFVEKKVENVHHGKVELLRDLGISSTEDVFKLVPS
jgi:hypothetical protein